MSLLGDFLSPVTDIIGGIIGQKEGNKNRHQQDQANQLNYDMQKEFAQMGIRWKVEDALAAGIHPLAALGASTSGASPSFQVGTPDNSMSNAVSRAGQNLSRAVNATRSPQERIEQQLRLENMGLQNDLLRQQRDNQPKNPPLPTAGTDNFIGGQGDSGVMLVKPSTRISHAPGRPAQEAGARPDVSYSRTDTGLVPVIPEGLSESMEDDMIGKLMWRIRNQVAPNFGLGGSPPNSQAPHGHVWRWDKFRQEWTPVQGRKRSFGREVYEKFRYGR